METKIAGVRIAGIAGAVPKGKSRAEDSARIFGEDVARQLHEATGVEERRVAPEGMCTSDLCYAAAERLLAELGWERDSIDALVFVSQTPDFQMPSTSCCLHGRLGLSKNCAAFDINQGCSGYVYGLWSAASLVATGCRRILLLVGEIASRGQSPHDGASVLFGDGGTATALVADASAPEMFFSLGSDGSGYHHLIVPAGACRKRASSKTSIRRPERDGVPRCEEDLHMDGNAVFGFTAREIPALLRRVMGFAEWEQSNVHAFVLHQANKFILDHLAKKMKMVAGEMPISIDVFGNTSSASIPLTMMHKLRDRISGDQMRLVLCGFGVGLSWAAAAVTTEGLICPELLEVGEDAVWDQNEIMQELVA